MKNTLANVQAALNANMRSSPTIPKFTRALSGQITSLARKHALITENPSRTQFLTEDPTGGRAG